MPNNPPFSGTGNDLANTAADYQNGQYPVTIPANFAKVRDEILGIASRVVGLESQSSATNADIALRAGVNEFFRVARTGEYLDWTATNTHTVINSASFATTFATGIQVAAGAAGTVITYKVILRIAP